MSKEQRRGKQEKSSESAEKVVVAVKASKEIPKTALVWALTHVVQPGDCITLLVVVPEQSPGIPFCFHVGLIPLIEFFYINYAFILGFLLDQYVNFP